MFYGLAKYSPQLLAVLRIVTALLFFEHGTQKLLGFPPMPAGMEAPAGMNPMMLFAASLPSTQRKPRGSQSKRCSAGSLR